jgi:hypothetical protein
LTHASEMVALLWQVPHYSTDGARAFLAKLAGSAFRTVARETSAPPPNTHSGHEEKTDRH